MEEYYYRVKEFVHAKIKNEDKPRLIDHMDFKHNNLLEARKQASSWYFMRYKAQLNRDSDYFPYQIPNDLTLMEDLPSAIYMIFVEIKSDGQEIERIIEGLGLEEVIENRKFELKILRDRGLDNDLYTYYQF